MHQLQHAPQFNESVIVSTCNRTEIYCSLETADPQALLGWLSEFHHVAEQDLAENVYVHMNQDAVNHLMRVACGLDSLVLGKPQILGQIKQAFNTAKQHHAIQPTFGIVSKTFSVAKQVRTETDIGTSAVSVACAAVNLAKAHLQ